MFINGEWVKTAKTLQVKNPATGETVYKVNTGGKKEIKQAIEAAKYALQKWSKIPAIDRANYMNSIASIMKEEKERLAQVITEEMGKPIRDSRGEVNRSIDFFRWYAEEARRVYGETIPSSSMEKRILVTKHPIGVIGAITPWNFPLSMLARKAAPAIAAGCTMIVKPASQSPQSAIEMFRIIERAGLPNGVMNLVIAPSHEVSEEFMSSRDVRKITFTGSTEVGKELYQNAAKTVKQVSLELGGHAPFIVFDDADLELAAQDLISTKFRCSGQMCTASNRIYVHENVIDEFSRKLTDIVNSLKVGNGANEDTIVGPLIDQAALEKVSMHIEDAVEKGAKILTGGSKLLEGEYSQGNFIEPSVLTDINKNMLLYTEETFGPVAPLISFNSEEELENEINHDQYGLMAYMYSQDMSRIIRMVDALEYGVVGVNDPTPSAVEGPFGGMKESGIGREGGHQGIEEYLETKLISIKYK